MQKETEWMTTKRAAREWNVSERTARRYFDLLGAPILWLPDETGKKRLRRVLPAGTPRPEVPKAGNPKFYLQEFQRIMSGRRWDEHITKADLKALEEAERDEAIGELLEGIEVGMPPEPEGGWVPYPMQEPEEIDLPPHLMYPDKVTRDRMARKAARQPKKPREPEDE